MIFTVMSATPPSLISINQLNTPGNPLVPRATANQTATLSGTTKPEVLGVPQDYGLANSQQWTLTVQRALPANILLEVDFVGSKSTHFDRPAEYNLINVLAGQTARPLPQWGAIEFINTDASGTYEVFITQVDDKASQSLTFLSSYTF